MSMRLVLAELVVLLLAAPAGASLIPPILIDYAHLNGGVEPVPDGLLRLAPRSLEEARVAWIMVSPADEVRVELIGNDGGVVRPIKLDLPNLDVYRSAIQTHEMLGLSAETLRGLRGRRREIALSPARSVTQALLRDQRVRAELPEGVDAESVLARYVERLPEGGLRLHLTGASPGAFTRTVDFVDVEDLNRATGLHLGPADLWHPVLSFWRERSDGMAVHFVLKTRQESFVDCERALQAEGQRAVGA